MSGWLGNILGSFIQWSENLLGPAGPLIAILAPFLLMFLVVILIAFYELFRGIRRLLT